MSKTIYLALAFVSATQAYAVTCKPDPTTVSVNIGFSYGKTPLLDLQAGPLKDSKFYQSMAASFAPRTKIATMNDSIAPTGTGKEEFLKRLKETIGAAQTVNFNYAGHGVLMPDGQFALVLPSIPQDVVDTCLKVKDPGHRGIEAVKIPTGKGTPSECAQLQRYLVTADDLKGVLGDRRVFGIIDACHSGSFNLGHNSSMLLAAQADESAFGDGPNGGNFTNAIKKKLADSCDSDRDGDQQISLSELTIAMDGGRTPNTNVADARGLEATNVNGVSNVTKPAGVTKVTAPLFSTLHQHPILNNRDWTDCYALTGQAAAKCQKTFRNGEMLETTAPIEAADTQTPKTCTLKTGERVQSLEAKTATEGRLKVEVPSSCGFSIGSVPLARVRAERATRTKPRAPADGGGEGDSQR